MTNSIMMRLRKRMFVATGMVIALGRYLCGILPTFPLRITYQTLTLYYIKNEEGIPRIVHLTSVTPAVFWMQGYWHLMLVPDDTPTAPAINYHPLMRYGSIVERMRAVWDCMIQFLLRPFVLNVWFRQKYLRGKRAHAHGDFHTWGVASKSIYPRSLRITPLYGSRYCRTDRDGNKHHRIPQYINILSEQNPVYIRQVLNDRGETATDYLLSWMFLSFAADLEDKIRRSGHTVSRTEDTWGVFPGFVAARGHSGALDHHWWDEDNITGKSHLDFSDRMYLAAAIKDASAFFDVNIYQKRLKPGLAIIVPYDVYDHKDQYTTEPLIRFFRHQPGLAEYMYRTGKSIFFIRGEAIVPIEQLVRIQREEDRRRAFTLKQKQRNYLDVCQRAYRDSGFHLAQVRVMVEDLAKERHPSDPSKVNMFVNNYMRRLMCVFDEIQGGFVSKETAVRFLELIGSDELTQQVA